MRMFASTCAGKDMGGNPPEWFQVFPAGRVEILDDDPALMDEEAAQAVIRRFNGLGHDMVIDYEHQTLSGERAPAAGWITELEWRGDEGLWARARWTEDAAGYLSRGEYRYFSPVFVVRKPDRRIIELYNVALTNQPRMKNLRALVAKHQPEKGGEEEGEMLEKLKKLLNLKDDAGEDEVLEAAKALKAKAADGPAKDAPAACKEVLDALGIEGEPDKQTVVSKIEALKAPAGVAEKLSLEVAELKRTIAKMKQDDLVERALKEGKISPEELEAWGRDLAEKSPEQFEKIVLSRPAGSVIPVEGLKPKKEDDDKTDEVQLSINKMLGIDEETWKKYGPQAEA